MARQPDSISYAPRGMNREEAARYIGMGTTKFDDLVSRRLMPRPKKVDGRVIWDRIALDAAFSDLPEDGGNRIDDADANPLLDERADGRAKGRLDREVAPHACILKDAIDARPRAILQRERDEGLAFEIFDLDTVALGEPMSRRQRANARDHVERAMFDAWNVDDVRDESYIAIG